MLQKNYFSKTAVGWSAKNIEEAKIKGRMKRIADTLIKAEKDMLVVADRKDEAKDDAAFGQDDFVILTEAYGCDEEGAFTAVWNDEGHSIETEREDFWVEEKLKVDRHGNTTTYRYKCSDGAKYRDESYGSPYSGALPEDATNILMIKEDQGEGQDPKITIIEGAFNLFMNGVAEKFKGVSGGLPSIQIKFK